MSDLLSKYTAIFFSSLETDQTKAAQEIEYLWSKTDPNCMKQSSFSENAVTEVWWWELNFKEYPAFCLKNICQSSILSEF